MAEVYGPIDYQRLARSTGRANRADRVVINLAVAHAGFPDPASLVFPTGGQRIQILNMAGVFTLLLVFQDGSTIALTNADLVAGDILDWDFFQLYVTNAAQPGLAVTIIIDNRIIVGVGGL